MRHWQVNRHFLKVLKVIVWIASTLFFLLYLLPLGLFRIPSVQREAASQVAKLLTEVFDSPVKLDRVDLTGWTNVEAHGVLVLDTAGRKMLSAERLVGGLSLTDFITDHELRITSARLFDAHLSLIRDPKTGRLNIQHTIDHLSKPRSTEESLPVDINSIIIRDMRLSLSESGRETLLVSKLSTRIRRLRFAKDYIGGAIDELGFTTNQGLTLKSLTGQGELQGSRLSLSNLQIQLPESSLSIPLARLEMNRRGLALLEEVELGDTQLTLSDFAFLYPALRTRREQATLQATYCREGTQAGQVNFSLRIPRLAILDGGARLGWSEAGALQELSTNITDAEVSTQILELIRPHLPPAILPHIERIRRAHTLHYAGKTTFVRGHSIQGSGYLSTHQGRWDFDLTAGLDEGRLQRLSGKLSTPRFDLAPLIGDLAPLGPVTTSIEVEATNATGALEDWSARLEVQLPSVSYRGYTFRGAQLSLQPGGGRRHQIDLQVADPALALSLQGTATFSGRALHGVALDLQLRHLQTDLLGLFPQLGRQTLALTGQLTMDELNIDRGQGKLSIDYFSLASPQRTLTLDGLTLLFSGEPETGRMIYLRSPYLTTSLRGHYTLAKILPDLRRTLYHHYPALNLAREARTAVAPETPPTTDFDLSLQLHKIPEEWKPLLNLPVGLDEGAELRASYLGRTHELNLQATVPTLWLREHELRGVTLSLDQHELRLSTEARLANGTHVQGLGLYTRFSTDSLHTEIDLGRDVNKRQHNGYVNIGAKLRQHLAPETGQRSVGFDVAIDPSTVRVHSDTWSIAPAHLSYHRGELHVEGLDLASSERRISISGALSARPEDHLNVALKKINLLYILESAGVGFNMINTELSGAGTARLQGGKIIASASVSSPALFVKGVDTGALQADLTFDSGDGRIMLEGEVQQEDKGHAFVSGYIRPAGGAGIDLSFDAERLRADFVGKFMDTLFDHVGGRATGKVRLFGVFEDGVTIEGSADVEDGDLGVRLLGTSYRFSHRIDFTPTSILFDKIPVRDDEGHTGVLHGVIRHKYFDHFDLDISATELQGMKVLQTTTKQALPVFGTAYGSGRATLRGKLPKLLLDVDLRSTSGTDVVLDFNKTDVRKEDRLFTFKPLRQLTTQDSLASLDSVSTLDPQANTEETELHMRIALQVTPEARVALRMGSQSMPNEVVTRCEGNLQIEVPHTGSPTTYGSLTLSEGQYVFNFEQLTRKRFTLIEGGRLDFRGDPMAAFIDLKASYSLTANIADLDAGLSTLAQRTTMPVNCIIRLGGIISRPDITLGVELPGSEPEIERRLQSLLTSEDERNRQFLYLMAIGKFYTPENRRGTKGVSNGLTSFAATTLSEQLNRILGNFSQDIQIGTNIRTNNTDFEDTDIELLFSGSWLGDRLLINGNVGYHDNPFLSGKYIGEFDLEYKLNPAGTLRLKGYSHYNNMYQYVRQSLTTQGVGFMFQKRFDSLQELFAPKRKRRQDSVSAPGSSPDSLKR